MKLITGQLKPSKGQITRLWRTDLGQPGALLPDRVLSGAGRLLRADDRARVGAGAGAPERLRRGRDRARRRPLRSSRSICMPAADKKIGAYSKGMRQRVKLAQALVHDPELLILDEPLSGMDPIMRRRTIRLVKDWARAGKSIVVSSHILHEIEAMTSNILLIHNGRILAEGQRPPDPRSHRRASAHRLHQGGRPARARAPVPGRRRCAEPEVRGGCDDRADGKAGRVLHAADATGGDAARPGASRKSPRPTTISRPSSNTW